MGKINKKASLSICMIVKNEEKFLPDCLKSIHDIADQIIIVDTGSTDDTINIAKEYGAEVHHFQWCDDFSAARNKSIGYAKEDWILWLDADERLDRSTKRQLLQCLKKVDKPTAYSVKIRSYENNKRNQRFSHSHRLFSNGFSFFFTGRIHEQISQKSSAQFADNRRAGFILDHLGYDAEIIDFQEKLNRNLPLLKKQVRENPDSFYSHFTLGQNYSQSSEYERALHHFHLALSKGKMKKEMRAYIDNCVAEVYVNIEDYSEAAKYARHSLTLYERQCAAWYLLFKIADALGDRGETVKYLEKLYQNLTDPHNHPTPVVDTSPEPMMVLDTLIKELVRLGDKEKAVRYLREGALTYGNSKYLNGIAELQPEKKNLADLHALIGKVIQNGFDTPDNLDMFALVNIKLGRFQDALNVYWVLYEKAPGNIEVLKRMAGLYAKLGDMQKAQEILIIAQGKG